jgi:8-demethyl-8-alpha-L-rhamnosyltetracenomycin-C 2'-O-methyltransferase
VVTSFHILFPYLVDGGLYLIEDMQTTFWPQWGGSSMSGAIRRNWRE